MQYKQCGLTPQFSTGQNLLKKKYWEKINIDTFQLRKALSTWQNLLKKILRKDKYWHNQLRKVFW